MKKENNLTDREEAAVRRHYGDSLLLVESWNETDEVTGERCRCLGILFTNEKKAVDLSRCANWDEFVAKMNHCMMKQFSALEKGGRMFTLVGDMKRKGVLYSMLCDIIKPGTLEQIIIKTQHNCVSDRKTYSNRNFVPIVHEYLLVTKKDDALIIPVSISVRKKADIRNLQSPSWRDTLIAVLKENGEMSLAELYDAIKDSRKASVNPNWQAKIRQTVQDGRYFKRTSRGVYQTAS